MLEVPRIAGYDYGTVPRSPVTLDELSKLKQTIGFDDADQRALRRAGDLLSDEAEDLVAGWRKIIGSQDHLAQWFQKPDGKPDEHYKGAVKPRFVQWVVDLFSRPLDQDWLDYQEEIGLRHTPAKKNTTDGSSSPPLVPLRYLLAFAVPVVQDVRGRLQQKGLPAEEAERLHAAWMKAVMLSLVLWARPYTKDNLW